MHNSALSCISLIWRSRPCLAENFFPQQAQGRTSSDIPKKYLEIKTIFKELENISVLNNLDETDIF
ncbi:unnamed protein product [Schistosoma curassoni]|uniref:Uncharacterized protein n=1 Tax=Schistosoma curassoni TaxID=6186 RepID=A0A183JT85_9TREM|nr:unnamed protein product [Schistosoma curassoni]